jgi:hypothetical protein
MAIPPEGKAAGGHAVRPHRTTGRISRRAVEQSTVDQYAANLTRLLPSLFGERGRPVPRGKGILMVHVEGYVGNRNKEEPESVTAGRLLRVQLNRMQRRHRIPMAISADNVTLAALHSMGHLHLWDKTLGGTAYGTSTANLRRGRSS